MTTTCAPRSGSERALTGERRAVAIPLLGLLPLRRLARNERGEAGRSPR